MCQEKEESFGFDLQNGLGKVKTGRPVVKTWFPAGLVENVIHLGSF